MREDRFLLEEYRSNRLLQSLGLIWLDNSWHTFCDSSALTTAKQFSIIPILNRNSQASTNERYTRSIVGPFLGISGFFINCTILSKAVAVHGTLAYRSCCRVRHRGDTFFLGGRFWGRWLCLWFLFAVASTAVKQSVQQQEQRATKSQKASDDKVKLVAISLDIVELIGLQFVKSVHEIFFPMLAFLIESITARARLNQDERHEKAHAQDGPSRYRSGLAPSEHVKHEKDQHGHSGKHNGGDAGIDQVLQRMTAGILIAGKDDNLTVDDDGLFVANFNGHKDCLVTIAASGVFRLVQSPGLRNAETSCHQEANANNAGQNGKEGEQHCVPLASCEVEEEVLRDCT
jgi:hypothetical protein